MSEDDDELWLNRKHFGVILDPTYGAHLVLKTRYTKLNMCFFLCDMLKRKKARNLPAANDAEQAEGVHEGDVVVKIAEEEHPAALRQVLRFFQKVFESLREYERV